MEKEKEEQRNDLKLETVLVLQGGGSLGAYANLSNIVQYWLFNKYYILNSFVCI